MKSEQNNYLKLNNFMQDKEKVFINKVNIDNKQNLHFHNFIEIAYVASGKGLHQINNNKFKVNKGDLFIIDYKKPHVFLPTSDSNNFVVYNCIFQPEFIDNSLINSRELSEVMHHFLFQSLFPEEKERCANIKLIDKKYTTIENIYEKMYREYKVKEIGYTNLIRAYIIELLILIFRLYQKENNYNNQLELKRKEIIEKTISFMKDNFSREIKLDDLATIAMISPNYFSSLFKKYTGMNVTEYIQNLRIKKACRLLKETDKNVINIAQEVGYNDNKFFYKVFKKIVGTTPAQYRKK